MGFFMQHILDCAIADLSKKPWIDTYVYVQKHFFVASKNKRLSWAVNLLSNSAGLTW